ncbi:TPA: hypothetical protein ACXHW4_004699 [Enterobacter hormaechei]
MKKHLVVIYIAMICVGIVGVIYYLQFNQNSSTSQKNTNTTVVRMTTVTVAQALRDLDRLSVLSRNDYILKNITVPEHDKLVSFDVRNIGLTNQALRNAVKSNDFIPPSSLIEAGSDEYLSFMMKPGHVIYPVTLQPSDYYLLRNVREGNAVDIYIAFTVGVNREGQQDLSSPTKNLKDNKLRALIYNKPVLSVRTEKVKNDNGLEEERHVMLVDLSDKDLKVLKNIEGKVRIAIFPSSTSMRPVVKGAQIYNDMPDNTDIPVLEDGPTAGLSFDVNELRGAANRY